LRSFTQTPALQKPVSAQSASVTQVVPHAAPVPEHFAGAHSSGDAVFGSTLQVPSATAPSAFEHTSHGPAHAESQQTPSTHTPDPHCRLRLQLAPLACWTTQAPAALQYAKGAQSASLVHVERHAPLVPEHVVRPQPLPAEPFGVGVQVPTLPAWLQDSHAPGQAVLQHTPSAQLPLRHSVPRAQV
jgi:hypothetical protein